MSHLTALSVTVSPAELASRSLSFALGVVLFVIMLFSLLRTIVVPRALRDIFSGTVMRLVVNTTWLLARLRRHYRGRDSVQAWGGPLIIIVTLLAWLIGFLFAYGLMIYGVGGNSFGDALAQAGSSLFTLGFDAGHSQDQTILDFMAAATGPIVIALMIGFLPNIYGLYTDREVTVAELSTQAGEPAWGPEFLSRAHLTDRLDQLDDSFETWAEWATSIRLTHLTYPALIYVRSTRYQRHYVTSLLSIMDAAALAVSLTHERNHYRAYSVLAQGVQTFDTLYVSTFAPRTRMSRIPLIRHLDRRKPVIDPTIIALPSRERGRTAAQMAASADGVRGMEHVAFGLLHDGVEQPLVLTRAEFDKAYEMLAEVGYPIEYTSDDAWVFFSRLRSRYEFPAYEIARLLDAPPAPWSGHRRVSTPTVWPSLAVNFLEQDDDAGGVDGLDIDDSADGDGAAG